MLDNHKNIDNHENQDYHEIPLFDTIFEDCNPLESRNYILKKIKIKKELKKKFFLTLEKTVVGGISYNLSHESYNISVIVILRAKYDENLLFRSVILFFL